MRPTNPLLSGLIALSACLILVLSLLGASPVGEAMFSVKLTNINATGTTVSFGFTSAKVGIIVPAANTADLCIHWQGPTVAVCPAANTPGDDMLPAGSLVTIDDMNVTGIGITSVSGTQTIYVKAWR